MSISEDQTNLYPTLELSAEVKDRIKELQSLITDSQHKADKSDDEDLKEAFNMQAAKLGLMVARLRRGQPEELPQEVEAAVEQAFEPPPQPTDAQLKEADMLIQRAALEKRRGNKDLSANLIKQAAEVAPGASTVLEALGDDLLERRQFGAAREAFKTAHRADPTNASVERKLAKLSMTGIADLSIEDQLRMGSFDSPFIQQGESMANPKLAVALSVMFPGLGQLVMGQTKKGLAILVICVLSSIIFAVLATKLHTDGQKGLPAVAYFPLVLAISAYFAGIADASSAAKSSGPRPPSSKDNRPTPPVNLPFE